MTKTKTKYAADGKTPLSLVRKRLEWVKKQILAQPARYNQFNFTGYEKCGTVGCIAGWLDAREVGMKKHLARRRMEVIMDVAEKALGVKEFPWIFNACVGQTSAYEPGTKAHARAGAKAIDKYLKEIGA